MRRHHLPLALAVLLCLVGSALPGSQLHAQATDSLRARIARIAAAEGFEPATAFALIAIESAFDTAAVGKNGPLGLMQIKLGTAALVMPGVTRSDLFHPETNVRAGLRYLQRLMDQFDGDLETALRAYKNGPRAVAAGKPASASTISYLERFRRAHARYAPGPPEFMLGDFQDDYDGPHTVTATEWQQRPRNRFRIVRWDDRGQFLIARNDSANAGDAGRWTRIDWMRLDSMPPYTWAFCFTAYDSPTREAAESTASAQRDTPRTGCNGHPFTRMRKPSP